MRRIMYGKIGRSMPLTLAKCGTLGGDIEMTATLTALANRYPNDQIILIGRNTGEDPREVGLPDNVVNPWLALKPELNRRLKLRGLNSLTNMTIEQHQGVAEILDQLTSSWFDTADEIIMWVGQHGTTNTPIPKVGDRSVFTKPQDAFAYYSGYILRGINRWRDVNPWEREPIFLNADPRNYLKMRDLKWPMRHPVLAQREFTHNIKHERYGDPDKDRFLQYTASKMPFQFSTTGKVLDLQDFLGYTDDANVWSSLVANRYSRLELNALMPGTPSGDLLRYDGNWTGRDHFGIVINEARAIGVKYEKTRLHAMLNWVMPLWPKFVHGTWSESSRKEIAEAWDLGFNPKPLPWDRYTSTMHRVRCTFTTPSSGSGWATTKPWEAFGLGVVCFFHPDYDDQNHILKDAHPMLHNWLRVKTPQELRDRVIHLSTAAGRADWEALVRLQKEHFDRNVNDPMFMQMIDDRLEHRS